MSFKSLLGLPACLLSILIAGACRAQPGQPLPTDGWIATASSSESAREDGSAANVLDFEPSTIWHSKYSGGVDALPHSITIDFDGLYLDIGGITYLPRQDGPNGNIGEYEVYTSVDGTRFPTEPVASGTWPDNDELKTATFEPVRALAVRIVALTEAGGRGPWSSAAEIRVLSGIYAPRGELLPRDGWTAVASSQETQRENGVAANVLDGNARTIWHSKWSSGADPLPHDITITLGGGPFDTEATTGLAYTPRPADVPNGRIGLYEVYLSQDGVNFDDLPVARGIWWDTADVKVVAWYETPARAVRLRALTEAGERGGRGPWASAAEIGIYGTNTCGDLGQPCCATSDDQGNFCYKGNYVCSEGGPPVLTCVG